MTKNHERILKLVMKNIVPKIAHNKKEEAQIEALKKEVQRNETMLSKLSEDEKRSFVNEIVTSLNWSSTIVDQVLKEESNDEIDVTSRISPQKMRAFEELYSVGEDRLNAELVRMIEEDEATGKHRILYGRLTELESAKGEKWGKSEIEFTIEKREKGYSFRAIGAILKRPERTVRLKYHSEKDANK